MKFEEIPNKEGPLGGHDFEHFWDSKFPNSNCWKCKTCGYMDVRELTNKIGESSWDGKATFNDHTQYGSKVKVVYCDRNCTVPDCKEFLVRSILER